MPHADHAAYSNGGFFIEKSMTEETGAVAPATERAAIAPAGTETTKPTPSVPEGEAAPDQAETTEGTETEQPDSEGDGDSTARPKLTRNQRLQRKAARLSTMVAEQAAELEKLRASTSKADTDSEPKEADYNGDWTRWQADHTAWKVTNNLKGVFQEQKQQDQAAALKERVREANDDFLERVEDIKPRIPDYDEAIIAFTKSGGQFAPHVQEELRDSEKGPLLAYQLAKNPQLAAELNAMSPRDAAREIGRLEAKTSLPQPKKQTQAPAPLAAVKGGATPSKDIFELAKGEDASAFIDAERKRKAARA